MRRRGSLQSPLANTTQPTAPLLTRPGPGASFLIGGALLALLVFATYLPTLQFGFVNLDDPRYVTGNRLYAEGFTAPNLRTAWTAQLTHHDPGVEYWAPLTVLTRVADASLYGQESEAAGGHHLTNLALHALAALLLFAAMAELSGALFPAWCVAALFAVHPVNAEVVCWLSARKDLVAGVGCFLTLWVYGRFLHGRASLFAVFLALLVGFLGKPMLVTLPFVLMLVDLWVRPPLADSVAGWMRFQLREKGLFLALAAVFCIVAMISQYNHAAISGADRFPPHHRALNFLDASGDYLLNLLWPVDLSVFYPHPLGDTKPADAAFGALAGLLLLAGGLALLPRAPFLFAGCAWFYGMLVPVGGLVQIGSQKMADRYLYLPAVGIFLVAAFGLCKLSRWGRGLLLFAIAALALVAHNQARTWENSETLFRHALSVAPRNFLAQFNLATVLWQSGDPLARDEAVSLLRAAHALSPSLTARHRETAPALSLASRHALDRGDREVAEQLAQAAIRLDPGMPTARLVLIEVLAADGRVDAAAAHAARLRARFPGIGNPGLFD